MITELLIGGLIGGLGVCGKTAYDIVRKNIGGKEEEIVPSHKCIPRDVWDNLWIFNKVCVKNGDDIFTPYLLEEYEITNGSKYFFKLPFGITTEDMEKCELQLKERFDVANVKIYHYKGDTAMVELLETANTTVDWNDIWKACGVYVGDKKSQELPIIVNFNKDELGNDFYKIKAPLGLSIGIFNKSVDYLKDYLNAKDVKFESLGGGIFSMNILYLMEQETSKSSEWDKFWREINIYSGDDKIGFVLPQFIGEEKIRGGKKYIFKMPIGKSTHDLNKKDIAIKEFLDAESITIVPQNKKTVEIHAIFETLPTLVPYEKVPRESKNTLEIVFGRKIGDWIRIKLNSGENGILINGMAGSGKSNLFKGMILDLALHYPANMLQMYLVDFKIVELAPFRKLKHVIKYLTEVEEVAELIDDLEKEMSKRYKLFDKLGVENIYAYNEKVSKENRLPFILFAIEEISRFTTSDTGVEEGYNKKLAQLNYRSRACGFMNLFCVQRMTNANIPREVSNSLGVRPSLKVADFKESELIVGSKSIDLSTLAGKGQGSLIVGGQGELFQAFKIEHEEIKPILKEHNLLKE